MSITPKGISILEIYRLYRTEKLIVNRRYQRKLVWTKEEKQCLIESILLNYPIPLVLFGKFSNDQSKNQEEMYEIIDGMQRLNAIFGFIENQFSVKNKFFDVTQHPFANELSSKGVFNSIQIKKEENYQLLESTKCGKFLEYNLAITIYSANSTREIEDVFNRINSNGKHLSPQEVRQAGVTTEFSGLVRSLSCEIRGDVSTEETLPLTKMPSISIDAKSINLGYGVRAEDTFWCHQGIINVSHLRDSEDEQIIADIILSIALNKPFPASKDWFDSYYGKRSPDKSDEIELAIAKYRGENLKKDIKTVIHQIKKAIFVVAGKDSKNFLRKILNPSGGGNPVKQPFYTLFMAFYELIIKENKEPFDFEKIFAAVYKLKGKIKISSTTTTADRVKNINLTKGLIQKYFKEASQTIRSPGASSIDFENYLSLAKTEAPNYDFKQGFYSLNSKNRKFEEKSFDKICQNIAAMANLGKGKIGYLFIGVSDKEEDTKRIEKLDSITATRFEPFGVVGLDREASIKKTTIDDYVLFISRKIRNSELPEWLKTKTNTSLVPINYEDKTVLMIQVQAGNEPTWYKGKLYIRDGHEKKSQEVSGEQISAVYNLFR